MPDKIEPSNFGTPPNPGITTEELMLHAKAYAEAYSAKVASLPDGLDPAAVDTMWLEIATLAAQLNHRMPRSAA